MLTISQALYGEAWLYHGGVSTSAYEEPSMLRIGPVDRMVDAYLPINRDVRPSYLMSRSKWTTRFRSASEAKLTAVVGARVQVDRNYTRLLVMGLLRRYRLKWGL